MNPANCLNCGTALAAGQKFCAVCGQKASTGRLTVHDLWHDAVHYFTHADQGIFHLLRMLATHPGRVCREFVEGRRKQYFKPLNFFLIVAGLLVFMTSTFYTITEGSARQLRQAAAYAKDPATAQRFEEMAVRAQKVNTFIGRYSNVVNMLATPIFAGFMWLFYSRGRYSYLEHLVANFYIVPFIMIFYALLLVPLQRVPGSGAYYKYVLGAFFLFDVIYRGIAYYQFMGQKGSGRLWKALGVSCLAMVVWICITYFGIRYYIRNGF